MITITVKGVAHFASLMGTGDPHEVVLLEGSTLRDLLSLLVEKHGTDLAARIYAAEGELRKDIRPLLNGRDIVFLKGLDTVLNEGDRFTLMPLLAGG